MTIEPKKLRLIIILVIIVGLALFSYFQIEKNLGLRNKIKERETSLDLLSLKVKELNSLRDQSKKIATDLEELSLRFLKKEDPLPLVLALEKIAERQNVQQEISLQEEKEKKEKEEEEDPLALLDHLTFSINVSGPQANLISYLQELERSNFLLDVTSLILSKGEEETIKASLVLRAFTL